MNLAIGGEGGYRGKEGQFKWSKSGGLAFSKKRKENTEIDREYREKLSYSRKENWKDPNYRGKFNFSGEHNPFYNRVHSQESRDKIGKANSISQKGEKNSQFGTKWIHSLDLKENKRISKEEEVPDGWKLGRKIKF